MGALQGRDPWPLSHARALWRQSRRHPRGLARLFRQGAKAAHARRSGAARGPAAIAGISPTGSLSREGEARARSRARPHRRQGTVQRCRDRACQARRRADGEKANAAHGTACRRPVARRHAERARDQAHDRCGATEGAGKARPRARRDARRRHVGRHRRGRQRDRRGAGPRRLARLFRRATRRRGRSHAGGALAGLGAEAIHLWARLRGRADPPREPDRGPADPLCRLCAREFRSDFPGHGHGAPRIAIVAERAGGRRARCGRPEPADRAACRSRRAARAAEERSAGARPRAWRRGCAAHRSHHALCRAWHGRAPWRRSRSASARRLSRRGG